MKAAILCPGPSLPLFLGTERPDVIIGVNRAAAAFPCDYFVALDARSFIITDIAGRPVLVSSAAEIGKLTRHPGLTDRQTLVIDHEWLQVTRLKWWTKSLTTAAVLALQLDVTRIECYGVDWAGVKDWDGYSDEQQVRDANRWAAEIELWQAAARELTQRGIIISRHILEGQEEET